MSLTMKTLRDLEWNKVYQYGDDKNGFKTFGCGLENITITHDFKTRQGRRSTKITYRCFGRTTDSPSQAVKWYNAGLKRAAGGGTQAPGSPEQIKERKGALRRRGDERPAVE